MTAIDRISFRPSEAKKVIGVSPSTVYRWMERGLRFHKIDGTTLILAKDFEEYVRLHQNTLGD